MRWLQPWAWLGLGVLVAPVLVHLLSRRPTRTVAFPSLRFLPTTPLRPTRRTRVSDWPLLLLRMATLLAAVTALAQPVRRLAAGAAAGTVSTVRVVDTLTVAPTRAATDSMVPDAVTTLATASLPEGITRALTRLRGLPAPRRLEVVSTFGEAVADSAMFAAVPRDVALVLQPASPRAARAAGAPALTRSDTLRWQSPLAPATVEAVLRAFAALGGGAAVVAVPVVAVPVVKVPPSSALAVSDITRDAPRAWDRQRLADGLSRLSRDPVLRALAAAAPPSRGLAAGDSTVVLVRDATGAARVIAVGTDRALTLRTDLDTPEAALALLMAAGGTEPLPPTASVRDSATLARWATLPAAEPLGPGTAPVDLHRVPTDARWGWLAALLLLAVETWRRRSPAVAGNAP